MNSTLLALALGLTLVMASSVSCAPRGPAPHGHAADGQDVALDHGTTTPQPRHTPPPRPVFKPIGPPWTPSLVDPTTDGGGAQRDALRALAPGFKAPKAVAPTSGQPPMVWRQDDGSARGVGSESLEKLSEAVGRHDEVRCLAGICAFGAPGDLWFVALSPNDGPGFTVAGVLSITGPGVTTADAFKAWRIALADALPAKSHGYIGRILADEEGRRFGSALKTAIAWGEAAPNNPWPIFYQARALAAGGHHRQAFVALMRLVVNPDPRARAALNRIQSDEEFATMRQHSAVAKALTEMEAAAPTDFRLWVTWMQRFRGLPSRMQHVLEGSGEKWQHLVGILDATALRSPLWRDHPDKPGVRQALWPYEGGFEGFDAERRSDGWRITDLHRRKER